MVKETRFDHHAVRVVKGLSLGTEYMPGQIIYLDTQTSALEEVTSDDVSWTLKDIDGILPSGATRPTNAVAAILDVAVNDSGSAGEECYLAIATPGIIVAGKTQYIYCGDVNDRIGTRTVIVEISSDGKFAYMINATGNNFDRVIKLIGWVIAGTLTTPITLPNEELFARFSVNQ